jgi:uncharacterized protein (DUF433 family)
MREDMTYPHITLNSRGVLCIDGTHHRAIDIVADHVAHAYNAAQIVEQYPYLSPVQVHAALTFYYDQQDAMGTALVSSYAQAEPQHHIPQVGTSICLCGHHIGPCLRRPAVIAALTCSSMYSHSITLPASPVAKSVWRYGWRSRSSRV